MLSPETSPRRAASKSLVKPRIRPEIQWTLDAITGAAAYVGNDRLDIQSTLQRCYRTIKCTFGLWK